MKRSKHTLALFLILVISLMAFGSAHALEFQTDPSGGAANNPVSLKFEFGSTLNITTTSDSIAINGLVPGTSDISSNGWAVTVSTNNRSGYTLSATVGCSSGEDCYDSKNLSDGTNNFSMLSATGALTSGTWGISLDSSATKNSNFQPLAKYDETATIINQTTNATGTAATGYSGTANTTVRIGAYAADNQPTGTYTNVINFIAVANDVTPDYMQDQTSTTLAKLMPYVGATAKLTDKRDGKEYTVAKLADNKYWMLDNLALDLTSVSLATLQGNTNATNASLNYLKNGGGAGTSADPYATAAVTTTWANSRNTPVINTESMYTKVTSYGPAAVNGEANVGVYYNFCAASAGSYCYTNDSDVILDASNDVCPLNWEIPSSNAYQDLCLAVYDGCSSGGAYMNPNSTSSLQYQLSLTVSDYYYSGQVTQVNNGYFWSSSHVFNSDDNSNRIAVLRLDESNHIHTGYNYAGRSVGYSIRCVFGS